MDRDRPRDRPRDRCRDDDTGTAIEIATGTTIAIGVVGVVGRGAALVGLTTQTRVIRRTRSTSVMYF